MTARDEKIAAPSHAQAEVHSAETTFDEPATFDRERRDRFEARLVQVMNDAALALMTSLGHRTGLFDVMATLPPSTSADLAAAAGLDERYVREWLGALLAGGVIEHDAAAGTYSLPPEHAALLTRTGEANMASAMQWFAVLGAAETGIARCFREGGGLSYDDYPRFHEVMAEESAATVAEALLDRILPLVPGLSKRLAAGLDVLDVGCGAGRALMTLAEAFPASRFTGYDLSPAAVEAAVAEARRRGLTNVRFAVADVTHLEIHEAYDLITAFDAIHDQRRPDLVLAAIGQALRPDGTFLMQDIKASSHHDRNADHPLGALLYTISCMHCMSVSLGQGGAGLGACWGEELALEMLETAGLTVVDVRQLPHDPMNSWYACRPAVVEV